MINTDLGLATRDPDVRICNLGAPFFFSLSLLYAIFILAASFILFHTVHIILL
jgi:hypothetical protein